VIVLEAREGEHIFLPAGYKYTLEATGVKSKFSGPAVHRRGSASPTPRTTRKSSPH